MTQTAQAKRKSFVARLASAGALLLALTNGFGCSQDPVLLVSVDGEAAQRMRVSLTVDGTPLPGPELRGNERKFALALTAGQKGEAQLLVEGYPDNECVSARGRASLALTGDGMKEVQVVLEKLPVHECKVDAAFLLNLQGSSDRDIWATGNYGSILRWDGVRWQNLNTGTDIFASDIYIERPDSIWFAGASLLRYDGKSFTTVPDPTMSGFYGVGGVAGDLWAVGDKGAIIRYQNGAWSDKNDSGVLWSPIPDTEIKETGDPILRDIAVTGDGNMWIAGEGFNLLKWSRAETKWVRVPLTFKDHLQRISVKDNEAWMIGLSGNLWRYKSGTWVKQEFEVKPASLRAVWTQDASTVWMSGEDGIFLECKPQPNDKVKCIDHRFVRGVVLRGIWGSGKGDVWLAGGVATGSGRDQQSGFIYHYVP